MPTTNPIKLLIIRLKKTKDQNIILFERPENTKYFFHASIKYIAVDAYTPEYAEQLSQGITEPYFRHLQRADYACADLPREAVQNRSLLCSLMEKAGFEPMQSEWWHFSLPGANRYNIIDIPMNAAGKLEFSFF